MPISSPTPRPLRPTSGHQAGFTLIELLVVLALSGVLAAMAVPMLGTTMADFRLSGDARGLHSALSAAKMRAASAFSQSRLYFDLDGGSYHVETLSKDATPSWVNEGGINYLSTGVAPGFGAIGTPPANTQNVIAQAPPCVNAAGVAIGNTACVVFNSRGIPVDATGAPTANDAVYVLSLIH
ncbi:MAG: prepilin-type N-terminal cleavage/methylation domain-containing protein, partial [Vicinamibacterales bacterium]